MVIFFFKCRQFVLATICYYKPVLKVAQKLLSFRSDLNVVRLYAHTHQEDGAAMMVKS